MEKNFFGWAKVKQEVQERKQPPYYAEGHIWWCSLGSNIGTEQDGKGPDFVRPVVVLTKFNENACVVVPLTGRKRHGRFYRYIGDVTGRPSSAILSQLRLVDSRRLANKIGWISKEEHTALKKAVTAIL